MVSDCMASSMFASILHVMHLTQAMRIKTSVINSAPQPPSPSTVLSVSNVAIFYLNHGEIGKIKVLRKAALAHLSYDGIFGM